MGKLTVKAIRRGALASVLVLITAIDAYLPATKHQPRTVHLDEDHRQILQKVQRGRLTLNAISN